ncbi:MAG: thiol reductant ABC exporter subunit CydC [Actinomycetota bacterium]|nr:thiol reductant ABC exporter subunit CydC [Actinomycetota bacterium]
MSVRRIVSLARTRWRRLILGACAGLLASVCSVALLATGAWLIARAAQRPSIIVLSVAVVSVRAFAVGRAFFRYVERLVTHDVTLQVLSDLRVAMFRRLERLAPTGLPVFRNGDLLARLVSDVEAVQDVFLRALLPWVTGVIVALLAAAGMLLLLPSAGTVLVAVTLLVAVVVPRFTRRWSHRAEAGALAARGQLSEDVVDTFERLPELVAYGAVELRLAGLADHERRLLQHLDSAARIRGAGAAAVTLATGAAVWCTLVLGVPALRTGSLSAVLLAVVVLVPLALAEVFAPLALAADELARGTGAAGRVVDVLDTPDPVAEPDRPSQLPAAPYDICVAGLRARWPGQEGDALCGVDLDLPAGRRFAIVGESGSGKTTLAMVLLRFLDPGAGRITLAGVDTRELDGDAVRRVVGLLAQDAHIFDSTIWENVRLARPTATRSEVRAVLGKARLLEWVDSLPDGLDTWVGEHGDRMSGGERQRLAMARVLLADFPVVVLDEPAEHLDQRTADALLTDLLGATRDRTVLAITHRLQGYEDFDEIVVLQDGRVAERGTHQELMRIDGHYRASYQQELAMSPQ